MTCPSRTKSARAEYNRAYYLKNRDTRLAKARAAYKPRTQQTGVCEICSRPGPVVWDHCHATGLFRGWLCSQCNAGIGLLRDDPSTLRRAADYLEARRGAAEG
jgi:hypothetical protein